MQRVSFYAACTAMMFAGIAPVDAAPIDNFMNRINVYLSAVGGSVEYSVQSAKSKTSAIVSGLALVSPGDEPILLDNDIAMGRITTLPGDILHAASVVTNNVSLLETGLAATVGGITMTDVLLVPPGTTDPMLLLQSIGGISAGNIAFGDDGEAIKLSSLTYSLDIKPEIGNSDPTSLVLNFSLRGLEINQQLLDAMDMTSDPGPLLLGKTLDLYVPVYWDLAAQTFNVASASVSISDMGRFSFNATLAGPTKTTLVDLVTLAQLMTGFGPSDQAEQRQALTLKLLSQISLVEASVQLVDEGIANMVVAAIAADAGTEGPAALEMMLANAQMSIVGMGVPALAAPASNALRDFLENGGTLTVSAVPDTPLNLLQIVALAPAPALLVDQLNVEPSVTP